MPLTKQIIEEVVTKSVSASLAEVNTKLDRLEKKVDNLNTTVVNFAGQVQSFDQNHTLLSGRVSIHSDRLDNLETKVFGSIQTP